MSTNPYRFFKSSISLFLAFTLIVSVTAFSITVARAETVTIRTTYYRLDTGVTFLWKNSAGTWQNGYYPGGSASYNVSFSVGKGYENVKVYPYQATAGKGRQGYFDFDHPQYHWNKTKVATNQSSYNVFYNGYAASSLSADCGNTYNASTGNMQVSYSMSFNAFGGKEYDLKEQLAKPGGKQQIIDLLGNPSQEIIDKMNLLDPASESYSPNVEGYLFFLPIIIQYDEVSSVEVADPEPEVGEVKAILGLPEAAAAGAAYMAEDRSVLDKALTVTGATLEKHYGDGNYVEVKKWPGKRAGENTGGRVEQMEPTPCTVTYRLTVKTDDGQTGVDTKTIRIKEEEKPVGVLAELRLPAFTYEGHPALAEDVSEFVVGGTDYSAERAYAERLATNSFSAVPETTGRAARIDHTRAELVFPRRGHFAGELSVRTGSGQRGKDTKPIEVRKTPWIEDSLSGTQKQNRKQILNFSVATYPGKPLTSWEIEISDEETGETIRLTEEKPQQDTQNIKTRAVKQERGEYFTTLRVEFLTKVPAYTPGNVEANSRPFSYRAKVWDSKGETDEAEGSFAVTPDLPPEPVIGIEPEFLRGKGTNMAQIAAEDMTVAKDGDEVVRRWYVREQEGEWREAARLPGYAPLSFGTDKQIGFEKEGVGEFEVALWTRERWTEPTLEEYVTEEDRLTGRAEVFSQVGNVAPVVSLDVQKTEKANIILAADADGDYEKLKEKKSELKAGLLSRQIDANIRIKKFAGGTPEWLSGAQKLAERSFPLGYEANGGLNEGSLISADDRYVYYAKHTWPAGLGVGGNPTVPVTLTAWEPYQNREVWRFTLPDAARFTMAHDDEGRYLYMIYANKTLILDKETGALAGQLPVVVGKENFLTENHLFSVKDGTLIRIHLGSARIETICTGVEGAAMTGGRLKFITKSNDALILNAMELSTGTCEKRALWGREQTAGFDARDWVCIGIDADGKVIFWKNAGNVDPFRGFKTFDPQGRLLAQIAAGKPGYVQSGLPILSADERGESHFAILCESQNSSGTMTFMATAYNLQTGKSAGSSISSRQVYPKGEFLGAFEEGGKGHFVFGAEWTYVNGYGAFADIKHYTFTYDGNTTLARTTEGPLGMDIYDEFGFFARRLGAIAYGNNTPDSGQYRIKASAIPQSAEAERAEYFNRNLQLDTLVGDADLTVADVLQALEKERPALQVTPPEGGPGELRKTVTLLPGQTYHYEFDVRPQEEAQKGKAALTAAFATQKSRETFTGAGYFVEDAYEENFDGMIPNPFFLHKGEIENGMGGMFAKNGGSSNGWKDMRATTTFVVPKGKKAVLEFDYKVNCDSTGWKSGVLIDGERFADSSWNQGGNNVYGGHYMHPYLLNEGEHVITYQCLFRTTGKVKYFVAADNLSVKILSETDPAQGDSAKADREEMENGWETVSGSFCSPDRVMSYGSKPLQYLGSVKITPDTSVRNKNIYALNIPEGYLSKTYVYPAGGSQGDSGPMFLLGGKEFRMMPDLNNGPLYRIISGQKHYIGNLSGATSHTAQYSYNSSASIPRFEQYLYEADAAARAGKVFFNGPKTSVFQENETFGGKAALTLSLPSGGAAVRNLRIYCQEGGKRVYLTNESDGTEELRNWTAASGTAVTPVRIATGQKKEADIRFYKKGEQVYYGITYSDYEADPSKAQYWYYEHTPLNDGIHPLAGQILTQPIRSFDVDGKYTVTHWQEDDTTRGAQPGGNPMYDKLSNRESVTFYIEGVAKAPWVTFIATDPRLVREGSAFRIRAGVDDEEKDVLSLTTEVYRQRKLIYSHVQEDLRADAYGRYPEVLTEQLPEKAAAGAYEVICTVRDGTGAGAKHYRFTVASEGKITGWVKHTEAWEKNRKAYNASMGKEGFDRGLTLAEYMALAKPRPRGSNVFWSGEKFVLEAALAGEPVRVTVKIDGHSAYQTTLMDTGRRNEEDEKVYAGSLWKNDMTGRWGVSAPEALTFVFTAEYEGGMKKEHKVQVIMDHQQEYWLLHRLW